MRGVGIDEHGFDVLGEAAAELRPARAPVCALEEEVAEGVHIEDLRVAGVEDRDVRTLGQAGELLPARAPVHALEQAGICADVDIVRPPRVERERDRLALEAVSY